MAMIRSRVRSGSDVPVRLLLSSRTWDDVIYRANWRRSRRAGHRGDPHADPIHSAGWTGHRGRIDRQLLSEVAWPPSDDPLCFVCGPTGLVEAVATALTELGHDPGRVRTERFGPSGGTP